MNVKNKEQLYSHQGRVVKLPDKTDTLHSMRGLIFDFDGLILDTETPEVETLREVFAEHGADFPDAYWQSAIGRGADQLTQTPSQLLESLIGKELDHPIFTQSVRARVIARIQQAPIRPGVVSLLEDARAKGIPCVVASSSKHVWVDGHLARLGLTDYFQFTCCSDDVERAKPFPDLYLLASSKLGFDPKECLALEDSPNGTAAAVAAGIFVIAVPNSVTAQLDLSHANHRIETLEGETTSSLQAIRDALQHHK